MTARTVEGVELRRLLAAARDYEGRGYVVSLRPRGLDLPDFLRGFSIDLLAVGAEESVVVDIKASNTLRGDQQLVELAKAVDNKANWRFELIVTGPAEPDLVDQPEIVGVADILRLLDDAAALHERGSDAAALLVGWSAVEAALRAVARQDNITLDSEDSRGALQTLTLLGHVDRDDYGTLNSGLKARNQLAHGFEPRVTDPTLVVRIDQIVRQLLRESALADGQPAVPVPPPATE